MTLWHPWTILWLPSWVEMLPRDPVILLSFINTKLWDEYENLEGLCVALDADAQELSATLAALDYHYDPARNQFI